MGTVNGMTTWFTSDPHFGHANIIAYCDRPFASPEQMDEFLIDAWNALVAPGDDVWVLGDIAMAQHPSDLDAVSHLNGRKLLVPGNHDTCWTGFRKRAANAPQMYLDAGFDQVLHDPAPLTIAGRDVQLSHFPYQGDSTDTERYAAHRPKDRGAWLVHGHVHDRWRQRGRQINVGVDAWGGLPVAQETLAHLITAGPADRPPLPWHLLLAAGTVPHATSPAR